MPSISTFADPSAARTASGPDRPAPEDETSSPAWQPPGWDAVPMPTTSSDSATTTPAHRPAPARQRRVNVPSPHSFTAVLASLVALTTAATAMVVTAGSVRIGAAASHTTPYLAERPRGPAVVADPPVTGSGAGPTRELPPAAPATQPTRRPEKTTPPAAPRRRARTEAGRAAPTPTRPPETSPTPLPVPDRGDDLQRRLTDLCDAVGFRCVPLADTQQHARQSGKFSRARGTQWRHADRDRETRPHWRLGTRATPRLLRQCGPVTRWQARHCVKDRFAKRTW